MRKNIIKKNGFTLVELIVVIAIIGILSAILVPSYLNYVEKARRNNDVQMAAHMTEAVKLYCAENGIDEENLTGIDIRTIIEFANLDLIPKTSNWTFVYDTTTNTVRVQDLNEQSIFVAVNAEAADDPRDPTEVEENVFLLGKGSTGLERAINLLCNLTDVSQYNEALNIIPVEYLSIVEAFNPSYTMFISNSNVYTASIKANTILRIVCIEQTVHVPSIRAEENAKLHSTSTFTLGAVVKTVEENSLFSDRFSFLKEVDAENIRTFELPSFTEFAGTGVAYRIRLGEFINNAKSFAFSDDIVSISYKQEGEKKTITTVRKITANYYNATGLFAQGTTIYSVIEPVPNI